MKIIVVGAGTVGNAVCSQLANENHDITVIDTRDEVLKEITDSTDVSSVCGNGADISVLKKAGAQDADLLVAVTSGDEINILCCAAAKKLGTLHTVARVRNPEYNELMTLMQSEMNLSHTINPELSVAKEIYRVLRYPFATKVDTFCHGRVELAQFKITSQMPICSMSLNDVRARLNVHFLVCAVLRGKEAHIPSGNFVLEDGDTVCVTAPDSEVTNFFKAIGIYKNPVKNIIIVGACRITYYLQNLLRQGKVNSTVIDANHSRCVELAKTFKGTVICGNPTKQELLLEQGLERTDALVAVSDSDEENVLASMCAKGNGKQDCKILTMIKTPSYVDLFKNVGLDSIVSPKTSTVNHVLRYIRSMSNAHGSQIKALHRLLDSRIEALEFEVSEEIDGITDVPLKSMKLKKGILVACIVHKNSIVIPSGNDMIQKGDTVIVVTAKEQIKGLEEILR